MIVKSDKGLAQIHNDRVWVQFKRYSMFLDVTELDELIALLEAIQQEIAVEQLETRHKLGVSRETMPKSGV